MFLHVKNYRYRIVCCVNAIDVARLNGSCVSNFVNRPNNNNTQKEKIKTNANTCKQKQTSHWNGMHDALSFIYF